MSQFISGLFYSIDLFVFVPAPYCFDYYSFIVSFEIWECVTVTSFVPLCQNCFGCSEPLWFQTDFRIIRYSSVFSCNLGESVGGDLVILPFCHLDPHKP